jgi:hypothetical protein
MQDEKSRPKISIRDAINKLDECWLYASMPDSKGGYDLTPVTLKDILSLINLDKEYYFEYDAESKIYKLFSLNEGSFTDNEKEFMPENIKEETGDYELEYVVKYNQNEDTI